MKDLSTISHFNAEQQSTDGIVSHMLMGFVERKISPQTIADVLRAQIFESQIPVQLLNSETCNGILEAITLANSTEECSDLVLYLSTHPDFPECLTFKSAAGALQVLLRYAQKKVEMYKKQIAFRGQQLNYDDFLEQNFFTLDDSPEVSLLGDVKRIDILIEEISAKILNIYQTSEHSIDFIVKENLANFIKSSNPVFTKILRSSVHFQHLRFIFSNPQAGTTVKGFLPKPYDMIILLLKTPDEQLLRNGVGSYKTEPAEKNSSGRIKYLRSVIESLQTSPTEIKKSFLIEWLFDKSLLEARRSIHAEDARSVATVSGRAG